MISLCYSDGKAYVWNSDDWYTLRAEHRIVGQLLGRLPSHPNQDVFLGLPMLLMSEETSLLLEKNICELYELLDLKTGPSEEQLKEAEVLQKKQVEEQIEEIKKRKIETFVQHIDKIIEGKKKKLLTQGVPEKDIKLDKETMIKEETEKIMNSEFPVSQVLMYVPTEYPWESAKRKVGIEEIKPSVLEGENRLKYAVFKDLWEKGYHITDGLKFGADFLVYPGDPLNFHATYMVRCIDSRSDLLRPSSVVAIGRLSVSVNKLAVLAYYGENGQISYQTVQWHDSVNG